MLDSWRPSSHWSTTSSLGKTEMHSLLGIGVSAKTPDSWPDVCLSVWSPLWASVLHDIFLSWAEPSPIWSSPSSAVSYSSSSSLPSTSNWICCYRYTREWIWHMRDSHVRMTCAQNTWLWQESTYNHVTISCDCTQLQYFVIQEYSSVLNYQLYDWWRHNLFYKATTDHSCQD